MGTYLLRKNKVLWGNFSNFPQNINIALHGSSDKNDQSPSLIALLVLLSILFTFFCKGIDNGIDNGINYY
jgi:hypothetical protein